ncbi:MAG: hypothetical protein RR847_04240, partial [Bacilli bacterium]
MNKRNNKLKPWVKLTLNIILIVFLATIICYVSFVIHINMKKDKKTFAINYNNEPRLDYQVCIKENPYYLSKCLNKGKTYPSSIIETINYNISDNFRTSKIIDMIYTYEVTANLVSETDSRNLMTEELWNKKYVLVQKTTKKIKANHIELNEAFNIDYRYYENIIENYKKDFPVSMKGYLKINYKVNIKSPDEKINKKIVLTSKISLLEPMVKITDKIP